MGLSPLWVATRDQALADMNAKANAGGCTCTAVPVVITLDNVFPIRVRMTHMPNCPVAVARRAEGAE